MASSVPMDNDDFILTNNSQRIENLGVYSTTTNRKSSITESLPQKQGLFRYTLMQDQVTTPGFWTWKQCNPFNSQVRKHSSAEWERIRPIIVPLYEQNTLEKAMEIMANKYNFHATSAMYKKRFKRWNVRKVMKEKEKEEILNALARSQDLTSNVKNLVPHDYDKVWRHARQAKHRKRVHETALEECYKRRKIAQDATFSPNTALLDILESEETTPHYSLANSSLSLPDIYKSTHDLLCSLQTFINRASSGTLTPQLCQNQYHSTMQPFLKSEKATRTIRRSLNRVEDDMNEALKLLAVRKSTAAQYRFGHALETLTECLRLPTVRLLLLILRTCLHTTWIEHRKVRDSYRETLLQRLSRELETQHSLTILYANLQPYMDQKEVIVTVFECIIDSLTQAGLAKHTSDIRLAKKCLQRAYVKTGRYDKAGEVSQALLKEYTARQDRNRIREALHFCASMKMKCGGVMNIEEAVYQYQTMTTLDTSPYYGPGSFDIWACSAAFELGIHYAKHKHYNAAVIYYGKALDWYIMLQGPRGSDAMMALKALMKLHVKLENFAGILAIEKFYAETLQCLEDRKLPGAAGKPLQPIDLVLAS